VGVPGRARRRLRGEGAPPPGAAPPGPAAVTLSALGKSSDAFLLCAPGRVSRRKALRGIAVFSSSLFFYLSLFSWHAYQKKKGTQKVLQYLSHQILRYMYGVLNVDERKNLHSLVVNPETNLLSLITP
jgi:hypothetical protein